MDLRHKRALVTGAGQRIGRALALSLAEAGVAVAVHYNTSKESAEGVVAEIEAAGGRALAVHGDLREPGAAAHILDQAVEGLGGIQILVNNASMFRPSTWEESDTAVVSEELQVHLVAPTELARELARRLPTDAEGRIVNMLDWRATTPDPRHVAYSLSKGALAAMTRTLASALGPRILVNAVAPGAILPAPGAVRNPADRLKDLPIPRLGAVEEVVRAVLFLVRDADYTTGAILPVDGGRHLT